MVGYARDLWRRFGTLVGHEGDWYLLVCGAAVGLLTALGAFAFAYALHAAEDFSRHYQGTWPLWTLPLLPALGALITGLLVHFFASAARGHGVPQVMDAVIRHGGKIPLRVGIVKTLASISTVGSGGSGGAEGPIVQIGATVGSSFAQRLKIPPQHVTTLVGCGAAAGIASVFNAPIAGVFFVLEIILRDFSMRTFTPIVIASVMSAATTQALHRTNEAIFPVVGLSSYQFTPLEIPHFIVLGIVCAVVGVGLTKLLHLGEKSFERLRVHPIVKPAIGAIMLGLLGIVFILIVGRPETGDRAPPFFGNGYATIRALIEPQTYTTTVMEASLQNLSVDESGGQVGEGSVEENYAHGGALVSVALWVLLLLCVFKAVGTTLTLGSGGSGGVFAPSLFVGATAGAAVGVSFQSLGLMPEGGSPASYALVGMAAVVAGTTFAPLTAILLLFEITRQPMVLLPIMLTAVIATVASRLWMRDSIYTMRLRQAGLLVGTGRDLSVLRRIPVATVPIVRITGEPNYPSDPLSKLIQLHATKHVPDFVVVDQESGAYVGMVTGHDMRMALVDREAIPLLLVAELVRTDIPTVLPTENLDTVMDKFSKFDVAALALVDPSTRQPLGLITRSAVLRRYQQALEEM